MARGRPLWRWALLGGLLPAYFLLVWGFVSYGFVVLTIYGGFWIAVLIRGRIARWKMALGGAAILYFLLMLFVTWMSFRAEIRDVIIFGLNHRKVFERFGCGIVRAWRHQLHRIGDQAAIV